MALRRACTLLTTTALGVGLAVVIAPVSSSAAPGDVQVGTVQDLLHTRDGRLIVAGTEGVELGMGKDARSVVAAGDTRSLAEAGDGTVFASGPGGLREVAAGGQVTDVPTGGRGCLGDVAVTSDAVWVVSACDANGATTPTVVAIQRSDGAVSTDAVPVGQDTTHVALGSSPGAPTVLAMSDERLEPGEDDFGNQVTNRVSYFHVLDVDGTSVSQVSSDHFGGIDSTGVLRLSPDGSTLVAGSGYQVAMFAARTGKALRYLSSSGRVDAVSYSAGGKYLAVSYGGGTSLVSVYRNSDGLLLTQLYGQELPATPRAAWLGGTLATSEPSDVSPTQRVAFTDLAYRARPGLVFEGSDYGLFWGRTATLHGVVRTAAGADLRGVRFTAIRTDPKGVRTTLTTVTSGAGGTFTVRDVPGTGGRFVYRVTSVATDEFPSVTATVTLNVARADSGLTLKTDRRTYRALQRAVITVHLQKWYTNRFVRVYARGPRGGATLIRSGNVNARGDARFVVYMPYHSYFSASWSGDARYVSDRSATVYRPVRAAIGQSVSTPVARRSGYNVYRAGTRVVQGARVRPFYNKQQIRFTAQQFVRGAWRTWGTGAVAVDKNGDAYIGFRAARGVHYRLRAWVPSTYLAYGTTGSWQYVTFR